MPLTDHVWDIMAYYIAQAALQTTLVMRPAKIVFGGGVMSEAFLDKVRDQFKTLMNGYLDVGELADYLTMPLVNITDPQRLGTLPWRLMRLIINHSG